jgi:hypothetical protein
MPSRDHQGRWARHVAVTRPDGRALRGDPRSVGHLCVDHGLHFPTIPLRRGNHLVSAASGQPVERDRSGRSLSILADDLVSGVAPSARLAGRWLLEDRR